MFFEFVEKNTALVFYIITFAVSLIFCIYYAISNSCRKLLENHSSVPIFILSLVFIILIGFRELRGDSWMYAFAYKVQWSQTVNLSWNIEWLWVVLANICMSLGLTANQWLFIVTVGYIGCTFLACKKLLWENVFLAMLFYFTSFSFVAYAVNTARSGLACSFLLLGISYWIENKGYVGKLVFTLLAIAAIGCHKSSLMPVIAFLLAVYLVKKPKFAIAIWLISLVISVLWGNLFMNWASSLGFDSRLQTYSDSTNGLLQSYNAGFRIDFILYGFVPIILYWYVLILRSIKDEKFQLIGTTYIIANAIWLQFIRIAYTDRFAYLSWFLLPMVLAYGMIRVPIWVDQDRKAVGVLFLQIIFTFVMNFVPLVWK